MGGATTTGGTHASSTMGGNASAANTGIAGTAGTGTSAGGATPQGGTTPTHSFLLGNGSSESAFDGFFWTYVDRGGNSTIAPDTGKVAPLDPFSTALKPQLASGYGIEVDERDRNNTAMHVKGSVAPSLSYPPPDTANDAYWDQMYPEICKNSKCMEYAYPQAALGVSLRPNNVPLGTDADGIKGLAFRIRLGSTHSKQTDDSYSPVSVSAPMDYTDVPDRSLFDDFGSKFLGANSTLYPYLTGLAADYNWPVCTFAGTEDRTGQAVGSMSKTCGAHFTTAAGNRPLELGVEWVTYCVAWTNFHAPTYSEEALSLARVPSGGLHGVVPSHVIKLRFDAYVPLANRSPAAFDFWIDDVWLLHESDWDSYCAATGAKFVTQ
jgi:hypothetical protein